MSKIEKFEDLICWQKARIPVNDIYKLTTKDSDKKDFSYKEQIRRAAISVMLNISEGFARRSHKEFIQFLFVSHGSIAEFQSSIYIALDKKYISEDEFENIYERCSENIKKYFWINKIIKLILL